MLSLLPWQTTNLLNNTATVHLSGQRKHMPLHLVGENLLLRLVAVLIQLLNDVVAKHIGHQLKAVRLDFTEDLFLLVAVGSFQFLLDESGAVLVATKFHHMVVDVLKSQSLFTHLQHREH